tara:strand:- start:47007 stop:47498 length:492 start_codon:yes stop_codon:yes gene_type:complete
MESERLQELFIGKELTLSTAESCTGGNVAHKITLVDGCSSYFKGGVVSYANSIKTNVLNVRDDDLSAFGAVSELVACQMANGVRKLMDSDYAISTSGIAGPDGGSLSKPVGTVWIGVSSETRTFAICYFFEGTRQEIIDSATKMAIQMVISEALEIDSKLIEK